MEWGIAAKPGNLLFLHLPLPSPLLGCDDDGGGGGIDDHQGDDNCNDLGGKSYEDDDVDDDITFLVCAGREGASDSSNFHCHSRFSLPPMHLHSMYNSMHCSLDKVHPQCIYPTLECSALLAMFPTPHEGSTKGPYSIGLVSRVFF